MRDNETEVGIDTLEAIYFPTYFTNYERHKFIDERELFFGDLPIIFKS